MEYKELQTKDTSALLDLYVFQAGSEEVDSQMLSDIRKILIQRCRPERDPSLYVTMTKEELAEAYLQVLFLEEDIQAERRFIREELLDNMTMDAEIFGGLVLTKTKTLDIDDSFTVERAKKYGAVKIAAMTMEEAVEAGLVDSAPTKEIIDTTALRKLINQGVKIEGVRTKINLQVREEGKRKHMKKEEKS